MNRNGDKEKKLPLKTKISYWLIALIPLFFIILECV